MKFEKIIGWFLLLFGITIVLWTLYYSYNIFSAKALPPKIFNLEENKKADINQHKNKKIEKNSIIRAEQNKIQEMVNDHLNKMLPSKYITKLLNLISWSIFAGISIFGGGKISEIGINMMKKM